MLELYPELYYFKAHATEKIINYFIPHKGQLHFISFTPATFQTYFLISVKGQVIATCLEQG